MDYALLALTLVLGTVSTITRGDLGRKFGHNAADFQMLNLLSSMFCTLFFCVALIFFGKALPSGYTILMGIGFGVATALSTVLHMKALSTGPVSYTTLIVTSALIIPALSGSVLYGEPVDAFRIAGIILIIISIILSVSGTKENRKATFKWLLLCLGAMVVATVLGLMQKFHQSSEYKSELLWFLVITFVVSSSISASLVPIITKTRHIKLSFTPGKAVSLAAATGLCYAAVNLINLYLSGAMDSIVFFPAVNGGNLLLVMLASVIFLHEKLSTSKWIGMGIGFVAVILLCI